MVKPSGFRAPPHRQMVRAGLVVGILAGAVGLMSVIGFMLVSPVLALVLMRIGGERRLDPRVGRTLRIRHGFPSRNSHGLSHAPFQHGRIPLAIGV